MRGGTHPGVYPTWDEASRYSQGQSGVLCWKFRDLETAWSFVLDEPNDVVPKAQSRARSRQPTTMARTRPPRGTAVERAAAMGWNV